MLARRIIPCLDVKDGRVVKGTNFKDLKDVDDPVALAKRYTSEGADELVFYDITASNEHRDISLQFVEKVARELNIPFSVGGGIKTLADIQSVLRKGADKVSINSAAIDHPDLISQASKKYGRQCIVVSMDVKRQGGKYWVYKHGGRINTGLDAIAWAKKAVQLGAGELVINSMDKDGVKDGFDIDLINEITKCVHVPVIASGGAGTIKHFIDLGKQTSASGYLAASVFHYKTIEIKTLKEQLALQKIPVRKEF